MDNNREIWVFTERKVAFPELISGAGSIARLQGGKVCAAVLGSQADADAVLLLGVKEVLWLGELPESRIIEDYVDTLAGMAAERKPAWILIHPSRRGKAFAGRLAARLDCAVIPDVNQFVSNGSNLQAVHMIFGGGALRAETPISEIAVATIANGVFEPVDTVPDPAGKVTSIAFIEPAIKPRLVECRTKPPSSVNLQAAKRIVCAGRGVQKQEDLAMLTELAHGIEAELACSRPIAEGLNWLPRERYIGVSGAMVKPDLYFSFGVSGQVQHTVGMSGAKIVASIDKDKSAPIFKQCDYGIVGDIYKVLPVLLQTLKS